MVSGPVVQGVSHPFSTSNIKDSGNIMHASIHFPVDVTRFYASRMKSIFASRMKSILVKRRFDGTDTLKSVTPTLDVPS